MDQYLLSASNIQEMIQKRINNYIGKEYNNKSYKSAYKLSDEKVNHRNVADTLYLKGGICADFYGLGYKSIKPSDLDYSISVTPKAFDYLTDNEKSR